MIWIWLSLKKSEYCMCQIQVQVCPSMSEFIHNSSPSPHLSPSTPTLLKSDHLELTKIAKQQQNTLSVVFYVFSVL